MYFYGMVDTQAHEFFNQLETGDQILSLFDYQPDVSFFVKDRDCRFIYLNRRGCEYCGVVSQQEALGKTDHDFFPKTRADDYRRDDQQVMRRGKPLVNRIESAPEKEGSPRLVTTTKIPLRDRQGRVVGLAGFSRQLQRLQHGTPNALADVATYLHQHFKEELSSEGLAEMAGLSVSHFERQFRLAFGTSPRQYLIRVRLEHGAVLLRDSNKTITEIAQRCGFYDHAHFSRSFRRVMGMPPTRYRIRTRHHPVT